MCINLGQNAMNIFMCVDTNIFMLFAIWKLHEDVYINYLTIINKIEDWTTISMAKFIMQFKYSHLPLFVDVLSTILQETIQLA